LGAYDLTKSKLNELLKANTMPTFAFIGLGNPKPEHALQRHNYGVMALEVLATAFGAAAPKTRYNSLLQETTHHDARLFFMAPQTYMNLSGTAVAPLVSFYKIPLNQVIVLHDELDIPLGAVRTKIGGGHAGHNGLKSLDAHIGNAYMRVRLGIGRPLTPDAVVGHVLGNFTPTEKPLVQKVLHNFAQHYTDLLNMNAVVANKLTVASQ
jgi:peptidyl-tRNA hydrolase, PTH1 family